MTEPDARKLNSLLKTHKVIFISSIGLQDKFFKVYPVPSDEKSVYLLSSVGGQGRIKLEELFAEDFHVTIPITQVKQGLQPQ